MEKIEKLSWPPGTMIYPLPAVLVSCGASPEEWSMLTVAWTGITCTNPAMCYISVRPERACYPLIERNMEFTINLTTADMARATDWAGVRSTRDYDKWRETGLTPIPGEKVACPTIAESPLSLECRVKTVIPLGSHSMFLAEILGVRADARYMDPETGSFSLGKSGLMTYSHGFYYELGKVIGRFGFSVRKSESKKKKAPEK